MEGSSRSVWIVWSSRLGWAVVAGVGLLLTVSAARELLKPLGVVEELARLGFGPDAVTWIGVVQVIGVALYLFPRTAVLGAILQTAYMGGGTAVHLKAGDSVLLPVGVGVLVWLGLFLRDERVRALVPWRR